MISIAAIGRYHFFEQARALWEAGQLDELACDYPRQRLMATGIPSRHLRPLPWLAACRLAGMRRWFVAQAGAQLSRRSRGERIKINSGYALESVRAGRRVIVDHGSLHERTAGSLYLEEAARAGIPADAFSGNFRHPWLLDRQDQEFERAEEIVVLSALARSSLIKHGVSEGKIRVSWPGVDTARFRRGFDPETARPFRIVQISSLTPAKGLHVMLEAWRRMALDHAELWLIGGGEPPGDLPAGVVVHGPVPQGRIPALLSECDVFALPSIADGFGLVVLQAMACELPVVVSDQCGAAEAVRDQSYARVVAAGDALALASALESFQRLGCNQCRELGREARRDAVTRFSWRAHVERLAWAPCAQGSLAA